MEGIIKVSTQELRNASSEFKKTSGTVKSLTNEMLNLVAQISGEVWDAEAANTYKSKFSSLQEDINRLVAKIDEHVADLNDIAIQYETAEQTAEAAAEALSSSLLG